MTGWSGVEMAFLEVGDDGFPQFEDPGVPFSQLLLLDLDLVSGSRRVTCSQNDDIFGLFFERSAEDPAEFDGMCRAATAFGAPLGIVDGSLTF